MTSDEGAENSKRLEAAQEALDRARELMGNARLEDVDEFIRQARSAMAELSSAIAFMGGQSKRAHPGKGAKGRILAYFLSKGVDMPVTGHELSRVSGIQEWARRVRELRVEEGWDIRYDGHVYRLLSDQPNKVIAEAWRLAKAIRKTTLGTRDRILQYMQARVGQVIDSELLDYVSGTEHRENLSELRREFGYAISTYVDRPDLKSDEYILESPAPTLDPKERIVSETLRKTVFERDGYRCALCGRQYSDGVLFAAHPLFSEFEDGGDTDPEDFVTLCREHHATVTTAQEGELLKRRRRRIGEG